MPRASLLLSGCLLVGLGCLLEHPRPLLFASFRNSDHIHCRSASDRSGHRTLSKASRLSFTVISFMYFHGHSHRCCFWLCPMPAALQAEERPGCSKPEPQGECPLVHV